MPDDDEIIPIAGWTARERPSRSAVEGHYARLDPLDPQRHGGDLWSVFGGHDAVWDYMPSGPFADEAAFRLWLRAQSSVADPLYFAIIDRATGRALGVLSLMEIRPATGVIEVGHIAFSPALQKTRLATEAIYLSAVTAFDTLGYRRFEWKCNNRNRGSKQAALRFGFTFEGLFRQHNVVKGFNRDTAWFAMLDHEWPARRAAFEQWLAPENFDAAGRQRRSLAAIRDEISG